jgi:hypothetical protein
LKYFFDTEFIEDGKTIDLISIGIVAEDGREFYAINLDSDWSKASDWVKANVLSQLPPKPEFIGVTTKRIDHSWYRPQAIAETIVEFVGSSPKPEFWAYYADYDWVVFCQLFGTMMDLPKGFPMYCRDIKQECDRLGNPKLPEQGKGEHNALDDARWNRQAWEFLQEIQRQKNGTDN